jgi:hypothetical protein
VIATGRAAGRGIDGTEGGRAMQFHTEYLTFKTARHRDYVNIYAEFDGRRPKRVIMKVMGE